MDKTTVIAITGSSALANFFSGIMAYYSMGTYYGWNQTQPSPEVSSGTSAVHSGAHPGIVVAILLACALLSSVSAWLIAYRSQRSKLVESAENPRFDLIAIQEPDGGRVPFHKTVRGIAHPQPEIVQVMIEAGKPNDKWWFPQSVAEITRFEWRCWCRFGDKNTVSGGVFRLCAIIPNKRIDEKIKELPTNAIRSKIMNVSLDRTLPDG